MNMTLIAVLFILSATAIARACNASEFNSYIRNFSQTLCPLTDYCFTKSTGMLNNETFIPCCSECSCDASTCYQTEKCCPDIESMPDKLTGLMCADTMTKTINIGTRQTPNHNGFEHGIKRYFIITSCPIKYKDDFINSKCRGDNQTDLDDFLWVSNVESDTIYQNYYCAICHGVENWVTWNLRTNCYPILMEIGYKNITVTLLSDDCEIVNEVPESKEDVSQKYQCYIPDFTSCNISGNYTDTKLCVIPMVYCKSVQRLSFLKLI